MAAKQIRPRDIFWLQNFLVERAWVAAGGPVSGTFFQEWWDLRQHFSASGSGFCHLEQKPPTYKCHLALSRQGSMTWDSPTAYLAGRLPGGPHVVVCLWHSPPRPPCLRGGGEGSFPSRMALRPGAVHGRYPGHCQRPQPLSSLVRQGHLASRAHPSRRGVPVVSESHPWPPGLTSGPWKDRHLTEAGSGVGKVKDPRRFGK